MSISQSSTIPILAGGYINLGTIQKKTAISNRQCKIIATIGPACWNVDQLENLMNGGMNTALLDMSHGDPSIHVGIIERIKQARANVNRNIAIMMELMGPEIRTGKIDDSLSRRLELKKGELITLLCSDPKYKAVDNTKVAVTYPDLVKYVELGNQIYVADGTLIMTALSIDKFYGEILCRIENHCILGESKNMWIPGLENALKNVPSVTATDVDHILEIAIPHQVDFISVSYVRSASDIIAVRELLKEHKSLAGNKNGGDIQIIAKIDNKIGLENFQEILAESDGVMLSRGDLGMGIISPQRIFLAQKYLIRESNIYGKPIIVATQMLESMVNNPRPTRAECSDVANAVLDGADALLLANETAYSPYYDKAIKVMARTICEAESSRNYNLLYSSIRNSVIARFGTITATESLASSAVKTAIDINAKLIIVMSQTGKTARYISKFRPGKFIICLTSNEMVARQTAGLIKGAHSYILPDFTSKPDFMVAQETGQEAVRAGIASYHDRMVIICGKLDHDVTTSENRTKHVGQNNNQVRVETILAPAEVKEIVEEEQTVGEPTTPSVSPNRKLYNKLQSFDVAYNDSYDVDNE